MDDAPKPWLPEAPGACPVEPGTQQWIESSMRWFTDEFGTQVLRRDPVLPTAGFVSGGAYSATPAEIEALVTEVCNLMLVDPARVRLELFDGSAERKQAALTGRSWAVGHFRMDDGRAIIAVDQSESAERNVLTAIAAHELCHLRLLGESRIRPGRSDGERLTDLLTLYFGFGIFSTNAALRFARSQRGWTLLPQGQLDDWTLNAATREGYHRLGYLNSAEFGYALSCYCWLRREADPDWSRHVDPGPLVSMNQGLAYLTRVSPVGELPTQRLLNKSVKIGNATVQVRRVTGTSSPSALMMPRIGPASRSVDPETPAG